MIKIKATRFMTVKDIEAEHTGRIDTLKSELKCFKGDESRRIKLQELLNKFQCSDLKKSFADKPNFSSQTDQSTGEVSISLIEANLTKRSSTSCGKSLSKFGRIAGLT